MAVHEALAAVPVLGIPNRANTQQLLVDRYLYFIDSTEDPQAFDPTNSNGSIVKLIGYNGKLFWYDAADTTSAHDGVSTLVTLGGERYKIEGVDFLVRRVLDKDMTAPPGSPAIGDAYIAGTASTGAWATHDDEIAIYTARGWEFIAPVAGWMVQVADEDEIYRLDEAGAWGLALLPEASSILASMLNGGRTHWVVENQTTNTPPSAGKGVAYIVGDTPTGDWVGHEGKIAVRETAGTNTDYTIYAPGEGWVADDKALNTPYRYSGSVWAAAGGAISFIDTVFTVNGSTSTGGASSYTYSATVPPTNAFTYLQDDVGITRTAAFAGAKQIFEYSARSVAGGALVDVTIGLFRDSETNAVEWWNFTPNASAVFDINVRGLVTAPDANEHTYKIRLMAGTVTPSVLDRRLFTLKELAS